MGQVTPINKDLTVIGNNFWVEVTTGDWQHDCEIGRGRADRIAKCLSERPDSMAFFTQSM